mmetsp:Transcript_36625/g.80244  ORF Transcript_36625/g.80244 Transcript_36625/m.80244 type:complete len:96 (-) Transcript_36625:211-498(-)
MGQVSCMPLAGCEERWRAGRQTVSQATIRSRGPDDLDDVTEEVLMEYKFIVSPGWNLVHADQDMSRKSSDSNQDRKAYFQRRKEQMQEKSSAKLR